MDLKKLKESIDSKYSCDHTNYTHRNLISEKIYDYKNINLESFISLIFKHNFYSGRNSSNIYRVNISKIVTKKLSIYPTHPWYSLWTCLQDYCYLIFVEYYDKLILGKYLQIKI